MKPSILANRDRAHLEVLKESYSGSQIFRDYVRIEQKISNTKSTYNFKPLATGLEDLATRVNQKGISANDLFVVTEIGYFIDARLVAKQSAAVLQTYPNATHFTASGATPTDLEVFYNAELSLKVANFLFIPGMTTREFRVVPQTQQTGAANYSQSSRGADFFQNEPLAVLSGKQDVSLLVNVKTFDNIDVAASEAGYENILTVELRGYTVLNAADDFLKIAKALGYEK